MGQDRTKVTMDDLEHTRFRLLPKSTTLDDLERPLRTVSIKTHASFGTHNENLNDRR